MASEDNLISFLFYVIIVYPVTGWLLKVKLAAPNITDLRPRS
jgi:hypothetical protein